MSADPAINADGLGRSPVVVSAVVKRKIVLTCGGWHPLTREHQETYKNSECLNKADALILFC